MSILKIKNQNSDWESVLAIRGSDGKDGLSAYEIAVKNGFIGTEQEWLNTFATERLAHSITIGDKKFDGTQDIVIDVYDGHYNGNEDALALASAFSMPENTMTMVNHMANTSSQMTMVNASNAMKLKEA